MWKNLTLQRLLLVLVMLISLATSASAGWAALITVKDFPDYAVAGETLVVPFNVWVPSLEPLEGLHPVVRASDSSGHAIRVQAKARAKPGEFTAPLVFPNSGDWVTTFDAEIKDEATLPPLRVIAPGALAPPPIPLATQGLRLFTIKGCNGCHIHPAVKVGRVYGPDLTGKRFAPEYLRRFLRDPGFVEPGEICSNDRSFCNEPYAMPNLHLRNAEIEALVAFIAGR